MKSSEVTLLRVYFGPFVAAQKARIDAEAQALSSHINPASHVLLQFIPGNESHNTYQDAAGYMVIQIPCRSLWGAVQTATELLREHRPRFLHCHAYKAALVGELARLMALRPRITMVYEIHGAIAFESFYRHRGRLQRYFRFVVLYFLENLAILFSHRLLLVSERLVRYYPLARLKKRIAIPHLVDSHHEKGSINGDGNLEALHKFASEAKAESCRLIVYSGGASQWQLPKETAQLMSVLIRQGPYKGVVLSTQPEVFEELVRDIPGTNQKDWFIHQFQRDYIIDALGLCDIGVLLREKVVLNMVASPTKLYEYLYADLALITTEGVPEAQEIIRELGVGVHVDLAKLRNSQSYLDDLMSRLAEEEKARGRLASIRERFTFKTRAKDLLDLYFK